MKAIEALREELKETEEALTYMLMSDTACSRDFTILSKKARVILRTIKKLEKLEAKRHEKY